MNQSLQSALAQVGEEVLRNELEPSCYARALKKAMGNAEEAMATYVTLRSEELREKIAKYQSSEERRISSMSVVPAIATRSPRENDLFRPTILLLSIFASALTLFSFLFIRSSDPVTQENVAQALAYAGGLTGVVFVIGLVINYKLRQTTLHQILLPVAILMTLGAFAGASKIIKQPNAVVWQSQQR